MSGVSTVIFSVEIAEIVVGSARICVVAVVRHVFAHSAAMLRVRDVGRSRIGSMGRQGARGPLKLVFSTVIVLASSLGSADTYNI